jgi:hypothetical protein
VTVKGNVNTSYHTGETLRRVYGYQVSTTIRGFVLCSPVVDQEILFHLSNIEPSHGHRLGGQTYVRRGKKASKPVHLSKNRGSI